MTADGSTLYAAPGNASGWAAMAKTIREVDEDKVRDCKEDIDTLLVFSGLFSAILTAFVVESYQNLSPDKQDTVIQILSQISAQTSSYIVSPHSVNSTIIASGISSSAFQPPLSAIYVNQLWFASLTLTLITASFAMLVKQWLREYLAFNYTSPHERLRARQFRHPGLATWKVYEIAGALPLLLQLALGLFLIGLCIFTWSVNAGIGEANAVLVMGWAFLFISATIAPIFSSRCPYKVALLKDIMISLRRRLRQLLYPKTMQSALLIISQSAALGTVSGVALQSGRSPKRCFTEEAEAVKQDADELAILREADSFLLDDDLLGTTILDSLMQNYTSPPAIVQFVLQALNLRLKGSELTQPLGAPPDLRRLTKRGWIAVSDIVAVTVLSAGATSAEDWVKDAIYLLLSISEQPLTPRARNAVPLCIQRNTISLIARALGILSSSQATIIRLQDLMDPVAARLQELLSQREIQPEDIMAFTINFIATETHRADISLPLQTILDLRRLSEPGWQFCSNVLASTIEHALGPDRGGQKPGSWLTDAIYVLLSLSTSPLNLSGTKALARLCLQDAPYCRMSSCFRPLTTPSSEHSEHTLNRLQEVCKHVTLDSTCNWLLQEIGYSIKHPDGCTRSTSSAKQPFSAFLADHALSHPEWTKDYTSILVERCKSLTIQDGAWPPGSCLSYRALMSLPSSSYYVNPDIPKLLLDVTCNSNRSSGILEPLTSVDVGWRALVVHDTATECITSLIASANTQDRRRFILTRQSACSAYLVASSREKKRPLSGCNQVRHLSLISKVHARVLFDGELSENWAGFYVKCAEALALFRTWKYPSLPDDEKEHTARLAEECLATLSDLEPAGEISHEGAPALDAGKSAFPDALFRELTAYVTEEVANRYERVGRLEKIIQSPQPTDSTSETKHLKNDDNASTSPNSTSDTPLLEGTS